MVATEIGGQRPGAAVSARSGDPALGRLDALTGLRGIAIAVVLVSHFARAGYLPEQLGHGTGQLGVMLFFLLSGFLMTRLYIDRAPAKHALLAYAAARVGRVFPLYLAIVALSFLLHPLVPGWPYPIEDIGAFARHALFLQGEAELWAIPVEVQFYGTFAVLWWLTGRGRGRATAQLAGAGLMLTCALGLGLLHQLDYIPWRGFFYFAPYFLYGTLAAVLFDPMRALAQRISESAGWWLSLLAAGLFVLAAPPVRWALGLSGPIWLDPSVAAAVFGVFFCALFGLGLFRMAAGRFLVGLGTLSYGLYLIHPILIGILSAPLAGWPGLAQGAVVLAGSVLLAAASWRWLEQPAMARIRSWGSARAG